MNADSLPVTSFILVGTLAGCMSLFFIACYWCQRTFKRAFGSETEEHPSSSQTSTVPPRAAQRTVTPPPSYRSVVKKGRKGLGFPDAQIPESDPPNYQEALRLESRGYI
ncbi:uncharacterized protein LOC100901800 [Galendromus occidentalis]|uniref:Uncharacterized protein LOC100901800 n=1 Tax=Galendromus occidentalis TaxID=34638 RepID=A0AAJ6W0L9_9ACAR|nr:uncharacterized protein LOC100901800 [Galendromus occidentalis]